MGWADAAISDLSEGILTQLCPKGNSMSGRIESGALVTIEPCDPITLKIGDIVLVKVKGRVYLHLIKAIREGKTGRRFQIGNNHGGVNGWTNMVFGKVIKIE
jgi:SOS-response transcriptional repressor LexA